MVRAIAAGIAVLLVAHAAWFVSLRGEAFSQFLAVLLWLSAGVAAFVSAWLAPRRKFAVGVLIAFPAILLFVASNASYEALDHAVDFSAPRGALLVAGIALPLVLLLCAAGAALGWLSSRGQINA
jgi:hypothetical protein